ncbi:Hypothetical predicted protein [Mytilus galloprovincialis]|nr:Hypothetical predicted protein [Mytilus galloprovincialis]
MPEYGRQMIYPYTGFGKLARFNYRYRWHNDRILRFRTYLLPFVIYLGWKIQSVLRGGEDMREYWRNKKTERHNWFAPVSE